MRTVQGNAFPDEIRLVADLILKSSPPTAIAQDGRENLICESKKNPIILSRGHFTNLIIKHHHRLTLHGGAQLFFKTTREKYWILMGEPKRIIYLKFQMTILGVDSRITGS